MNSTRWQQLAVLAGTALVSLVLLWPRDTPRAVARGGADNPTALLAAAPAPGFARADRVRPFSFPADHGAHPDFRTEWWYFTGHLADASGRPYGFQLTLFRFELDRDHVPSPSAWRTPRLLLGHFALSDIAAGRFHAFERLTRAHPALAGVDAAPFAIWLDDWRIARAADTERWHLRAADGDVALELELSAQSAVVLHGTAGLSQKSARPGNASYYYSVPRLAARGELRLGTARSAVRGQAWLDREWSTSALERGQRGWDWFALQLDDGANLMFYRLRGADGSPDPHSAGTYVAADGTLTSLGRDDVVVEAAGTWQSPATGVRYPQDWRLAVPRLDIDVRILPAMAAQEWRGRFRYWEGAVAVSGSHQGLGYVELTGY